MTMKKILLLSMALAITQMVAKAEDNHLYVQPAAGETLSWSVPTLQKMTFQNGQVVLTKKDGTTAYIPIATVDRMYICTPTVAAGINPADVSLPSYKWVGEVLQLDAPQDALVRVYNATGAMVMQGQLVGSSVDLGGLRGGLYVVNVDGLTFKVIKK